jgi:hypothetical protein
MAPTAIRTGMRLMSGRFTGTEYKQKNQSNTRLLWL